MNFLRSLITPAPPPYDALEWEKAPFPERCRQVCQAWALQGYGSPLSVALLYAVKAALFIAGWAGFCAMSPSLGPVAEVSRWWLEPLAFQKAHKGPSLLPLHSGSPLATAKVRVLMRSASMRLCASALMRYASISLATCAYHYIYIRAKVGTANVQM